MPLFLLNGEKGTGSRNLFFEKVAKRPAADTLRLHILGFEFDDNLFDVFSTVKNIYIKSQTKCRHEPSDQSIIQK